MVQSPTTLLILFLVYLVLLNAATQALDVLPLSTRQALLDRSRAINNNVFGQGEGATSSSSSAATQYNPTWSNRAATVLTPAADGIYTADRPFYWNSIDVGCRATLIELSPTELFVHSPVSLDGPMLQAVRQQFSSCKKKYIVTPNYEHTKFAASWYQNYHHQADGGGERLAMIGCPGLAERIPEVPWTSEVPFAYRPAGFADNNNGGASDDNNSNLSFLSASWDTDVLDCFHMNFEKNPFTGKPFFNEVIFFHTPTRTLLTTDLFWNYPASIIPNAEFGRDDTWELAPLVEKVPWGSRAWKMGMDKVYAPFFNNFMVTDQNEYRNMAEHIVNVWQPEMVIPAHGDILRGKEFIRDTLSNFFRL